MYNFFVNDGQIQNKEVNIIGKDANHISNVLRMKKGEEIYICNNKTSERFLANIKSIEKEKITANIIKKIESTEPSIEITLFQGLPKADKMEYIIQKSVELGINKIVPVDMKYCIAKIKDEDKKISRWQSISEAAAKQSKRSKIVQIERKTDINEICSKINEYDLTIIAYEDEAKLTIKEILKQNKNAKKIAIIIGPEGGISKEEVEKIKNAGAKAASLGKLILRTETASIAMLSMIMYEYEM